NLNVRIAELDFSHIGLEDDRVLGIIFRIGTVMRARRNSEQARAQYQRCQFFSHPTPPNSTSIGAHFFQTIEEILCGGLYTNDDPMRIIPNLEQRARNLG